ESGYEEQEDERVRVGRNLPAPNTLWLLDLVAHTQEELSLAGLPGINEDPLAKIRAENRKAGLLKDEPAKDEGKADAGKPRGVTVAEQVWNRDGSQVAVQVRAIDNKDRWIATVDFGKHRLVSQHRLSDPAWINWSFNDFGWSRDSRSLWY